MIRLILEITLWGLISFILTVGCNVAGYALSADTDFPNGIGNDKGQYTVEQSFYTIVPIVRIVDGVFKCVMIGAIIQFYATRMATYGVSLPDTDSSKYLDISMLVIVPFLLLPYIYKIGWGVVDVIWWLPFFGLTGYI